MPSDPTPSVPGTMNCASCGHKLNDCGHTVRVTESRGRVTRVIEGHPADMEEWTTFAGVFCSRGCARAGLEEPS